MNRHAPATFYSANALMRGERDMADDQAAKLDEVERLLNDPEVVMQPGRIWSLMAEISAASDLTPQQGASLG